MSSSRHARFSITVGGVPEHVSLPWYAAMVDGLLPGVAWVDQPSGTGAMVAALGDSTLDMAIALTEGVVQGITAGLDARIVAVAIPSALQWGIHVAASSDFNEPSDLVGARAAISRRGSGSHLMTYVLADGLDWEPDAQSNFVEVGDMAGARTALAAGSADFFLWDRFMTQPVVDSGEFRRIGVQPTPWPAFVVVARSSVVDQHRNAVAAVLHTVATTSAELARRDDIVDVIAERFDLRPETVADWWAVTEWAPAEAQLDAATLRDVQRTLLRLGRIDEILPADAILADLN